MKKPSGARTDGSPQSLVDIVAIDELAKIVARYDLNEVEVDLGDLRVRLARKRETQWRPAPAAPDAAPPSAKVSQSVEAAATEAPGADLARAVKSPMVGTAYLRSSPEAKPFVEIGSVVKTGDKLMLVEAMKTFNDIVAPHAGKVTTILVADGAPVEYDQPLMIIE